MSADGSRAHVVQALAYITLGLFAGALIAELSRPGASAPPAPGTPGPAVAGPPAPAADAGIAKMRGVVSHSNPAEMQQLLALGYFVGTVDPEADKSGVLAHDKRRSWPGLNFYHSELGRSALLVDMDGSEVYRWELGKEPDLGTWKHAELSPNGDLTVLVRDKRVFRIDKHSKLQWVREMRAHHDLWIHDNGEIYVLVRNPRRMPHVHPSAAVLDDGIQVLSAVGEPLRRVSLSDLLERSRYRFLRRSIAHIVADAAGGDLDLMHSNHIEVFDGSQAHRGPLYARGNMLVSMRNNHSIAILSGSDHEFLWLWGPSNLTFQHHPVLLDNGNVLVFSNGTTKSRVYEVNPPSNTIVWQYGHPDFFSKTRGSNQRLPNGNTLITESDIGHVLEVTRAGETVWHFANPDVDGELRHAIWRMTRHAREDLPFLSARLPPDGPPEPPKR